MVERLSPLFRPRLHQDPIRRGMLASILEGCAFSIWAGATTGNYLTGMALFLGAGGLSLGILGALPSVATMLQIVSAPFVAGVTRRRNFLALFSALQRFGAAFAGLIALALYPSPAAMILFVAMQVLAWVFMAPATVVWQGYMTDLVPVETRGRYFGTRNAWCGMVGMVAVLLFGTMLDRWPGADGFRLLYWCALLGAALNFGLWFLHPELPVGEAPVRRSFWESVRGPLTNPGPHRPVAGFFAAWAFAQGLAVPFFPVVLVQELGISFSGVSILATAASLTAFFTAGYWGRLQDRIGQPRVIGLVAGMLAAVPLLVMLGHFGGWSVLIAAYVLHGAGTSGMGLANWTLSMRLVPAENRGAYFAFFAASSGLTGFLTPVIAGPLTTGYINYLLLGSAAASALLSIIWRTRLEAPLTAHCTEKQAAG